MKSYVIDIDSMNEEVYSRVKQLFDLLAMTIGAVSVADALLINVPDEVAPVVVRVAGESGAVWYPLNTQEEVMPIPVSSPKTKEDRVSKKTCEICGEPIAHPRSTICTKDTCRRARQRIYQKIANEKKGEQTGGNGRKSPFGHPVQEIPVKAG